MEKNIKENANENIIIFSLLLSLKNNWENRREIEGKNWEKFYRARYIIFIKSLVRITSLSITMASHHHWPFQRPPPSLWSPPSASNNLPLFEHTSSHGWNVFFKSSSHGWNAFFKSGECACIHVFRSRMNCWNSRMLKFVASIWLYFSWRIQGS